MKKRLNDPEEMEHQLLNFIYAMACCIVFMGSMWMIGVIP